MVSVIHITADDYRYGELESEMIELPGGINAFSIIYDGEAEPCCCKTGIIIPLTDENISICHNMARAGESPLEHFIKMFRFVRFYDKMVREGTSKTHEEYAKMVGT